MPGIIDGGQEAPARPVPCLTFFWDPVTNNVGFDVPPSEVPLGMLLGTLTLAQQVIGQRLLMLSAQRQQPGLVVPTGAPIPGLRG